MLFILVAYLIRYQALHLNLEPASAGLLSLAGTSLEYGAYSMAGVSKENQGPNFYRSFGADALAGLGKSIPSGIIGAGAAIGMTAIVPATVSAGMVFAAAYTTGFFGTGAAYLIEKYPYTAYDVRAYLKGEK